MSKITQKKKELKNELKKINQILPKVTYINVVDEAYTDVTQEADPEDEWSGESTDTSHNIQGIKLGKNYGDVECSFEVVPGETYFLLYYLYSTGDSFGTASGQIEFVGLYNDLKLAEKSCKALNTFNKRDPNNPRKTIGNPITIWNDLGQPYRESVADDFFGGFDGADVAAVQLIN